MKKFGKSFERVFSRQGPKNVTVDVDQDVSEGNEIQSGQPDKSTEEPVAKNVDTSTSIGRKSTQISSPTANYKRAGKNNASPMCSPKTASGHTAINNKPQQNQEQNNEKRSSPKNMITSVSKNNSSRSIDVTSRSRSNSGDSSSDRSYSSSGRSEHSKSPNSRSKHSRSRRSRSSCCRSSCSRSSCYRRSSSRRSSSRSSRSRRSRSLSHANSRLSERNEEGVSRSRTLIGSSQSTSRKLNFELRRSGHSPSVEKISSRRSRCSNPRSRHSNSHSVSRSCPSRTSFRGSPYRGSEAIKDLRSDVHHLIKLMEKSCQYQIEQERRMNRIEVTINKTLIKVGDLTNTNNPQVQPNGFNNNQNDAESEAELDEFEVSKLPIRDVNELLELQKKLKNRRFRRFLVSRIITLVTV